MDDKLSQWLGTNNHKNFVDEVINLNLKCL